MLIITIFIFSVICDQQQLLRRRWSQSSHHKTPFNRKRCHKNIFHLMPWFLEPPRCFPWAKDFPLFLPASIWNEAKRTRKVSAEISAKETMKSKSVWGEKQSRAKKGERKNLFSHICWRRKLMEPWCIECLSSSSSNFDRISCGLRQKVIKTNRLWSRLAADKKLY